MKHECTRMQKKKKWQLSFFKEQFWIYENNGLEVKTLIYFNEIITVKKLQI